MRTHVFSLEPTAVMRVLSVLRYVAAGLLLAAFVIMAAVGARLPPLLWALPGLLLVFNVYVAWRLRRTDAPAALALVGHLTVDTCALFVLFWALGGATNPFVSLFLVPVALAATALSIRDAIVVTSLAIAAYTVLLFRYLSRITDPEAFIGFERHVIGMWCNFLLAAILLCGFLLILAAVLRARERELAAQRERLVRDDAVVSMATVAAGAAHALNTPLSTIAIAAESLSEHSALPADAREEVEIIQSQTALCAEQLRQLVAARDPRTQVRTTLAEFAMQVVRRWHVRRPEIDIQEKGRDRLSGEVVRHDPALIQALTNLLDNAADAAVEAGDHRLWLTWQQCHEFLVLAIDDRGRLPDDWRRDAAGGSTKLHGLGLGLTLSRASISRLGGELIFASAPAGGTRTCVRLPVAALAAVENVGGGVMCGC